MINYAVTKNKIYWIMLHEKLACILKDKKKLNLRRFGILRSDICSWRYRQGAWRCPIGDGSKRSILRKHPVLFSVLKKVKLCTWGLKKYACRILFGRGSLGEPLIEKDLGVTNLAIT